MQWWGARGELGDEAAAQPPMILSLALLCSRLAKRVGRGGSGRLESAGPSKDAQGRPGLLGLLTPCHIKQQKEKEETVTTTANKKGQRGLALY